MKYPPSIPLWRRNGELLSGKAASRVVLSSVGTKWNDVLVEQHHFPSSEMADLMYKQHVIAINVGNPITCEYKKRGQFPGALEARRRDFFLPKPSAPLRSKLEGGRGARSSFSGSGPGRVSRIAEVGLIRTVLNLLAATEEATTLHYIAMALRAGVKAAMALT
jgi:hypothetical protein